MKKVLLELVDLLEKHSLAISALEGDSQPKSADALSAPKGGFADPFAQLRARIRAMPLE